MEEEKLNAKVPVWRYFAFGLVCRLSKVMEVFVRLFGYLFGFHSVCLFILYFNFCVIHLFYFTSRCIPLLQTLLVFLINILFLINLVP